MTTPVFSIPLKRIYLNPVVYGNRFWVGLPGQQAYTHAATGCIPIDLSEGVVNFRSNKSAHVYVVVTHLSDGNTKWQASAFANNATTIYAEAVRSVILDRYANRDCLDVMRTAGVVHINPRTTPGRVVAWDNVPLSPGEVEDISIPLGIFSQSVKLAKVSNATLQLLVNLMTNRYNHKVKDLSVTECAQLLPVFLVMAHMIVCSYDSSGLQLPHMCAGTVSVNTSFHQDITNVTRLSVDNGITMSLTHPPPRQFPSLSGGHSLPSAPSDPTKFIHAPILNGTLSKAHGLSFPHNHNAFWGIVKPEAKQATPTETNPDTVSPLVTEAKTATSSPPSPPLVTEAKTVTITPPSVPLGTETKKRKDEAPETVPTKNKKSKRQSPNTLIDLAEAAVAQK